MNRRRLAVHSLAGHQYPPVAELSFENRYILNPKFRLRTESSRVLLYGCDLELGGLASSYYTLHPCIAILLALMDGQRTLREVGDAYDYVMGNKRGPADGKRGLWCALEVLRKREQDLLVEPRGTAQEEAARLSPLDYVICGASVDVVTPNPRLDFPLSVSFHLNLECTRKCIYCYAPSDSIERSHMPVSRYIELFDEASRKQAGEIRFSGADPLLNGNVLQLTSAVLDRGYDPGISTKQFVSPELARDFAAIGLPGMQISLDSADRKTAARMTGCPNYLDIAYESIENLRDAGIRVRVKAVATALNIDSIPTLVRELGERGVDQLLIDTYGRSLFRHSDDLFPANEALTKCRSAVEVYRRDHPQMKVLGGLDTYQPPSKSEREDLWRRRAVCSAGRSSITIMTDGSILPCDQVPANSDFIFGSVRDISIEDFWNSDSANDLVFPPQGELQDPCRTCEDYSACCNDGGRCLRDSYIAFGSAGGGDPKCPRIDIAIRY